MKRVIFFGAGASIPFYDPALNTAALTKVLCDPLRWADIVSRHAFIMDDANVIDAADVVAAIDLFLSRRPAANFEEVIEFLDKTASFGLPLSTSPGGKLLHDILGVLKAQQLFPLTIWMDVPFLARQLIAEYVVSLKRHPDYASLQAEQKKFLEALQKDGPVSLVSLNYDESLIEAAAVLGFEHGFEDMVFEPARFFSARDAIAFPHGHVRFIRTDEGMRYRDDGATATVDRLAHLAAMTRSRTCSMLDSRYVFTFDTFLVTAQTKDAALNENPFAAYYQRFASDLLSADELMVIGYSFGDEHFNRFILNFLGRGAGRRLIAVEYRPDPIDPMEEYLGRMPLFTLLTKAGITGLPLSQKGPDDFRYAHQGLVDRINKVGYGVLYPRLVYDKRGYAAFLRDFRSVVDQGSVEVV
jgi:hypothetical protein